MSRLMSISSRSERWSRSGDPYEDPVTSSTTFTTQKRQTNILCNIYWFICKSHVNNQKSYFSSLIFELIVLSYKSISLWSRTPDVPSLNKTEKERSTWWPEIILLLPDIWINTFFCFVAKKKRKKKSNIITDLKQAGSSEKSDSCKFSETLQEEGDNKMSITIYTT